MFPIHIVFLFQDPKCYPNAICLSCKELLNTVIHLKISYEKTSEILKTWFCAHRMKKELDMAEGNPTEIYEGNDDDSDDDDYDGKNDLEQINEDFESTLTTPSPTSGRGQPHFKNISSGKQLKEPHAKCFTRTEQDGTIKSSRNKSRKKYRMKISPVKKSRHFCIALTSFTHICPFCMINLPNAVEVKKHALTHKTLTKYLRGRKISYKTKFFSTPRKSDTIFSREHILHKCVYCTEDLPIENFWKHVGEHNQKTEFPCNKCDRVFRKQNHLNSHITYTHLDEFPYQCDQCDKGFVIKENYDAHLLSHTKPDVLPYKCGKCEKSFANKKHLYYHNFKHTPLGSFSAKYKTHRCKICLRTFESADNLQEHRIQFHNRKRNNIKITINAEGLYECDLCLKTYGHVIALKQHIRKTHGPKNLCSLCGASVLNLKQHMISHEDKKDPLECHICHKLLASKLTLSRHIRVHTGEKPYKCSFCDKVFKDHYPMRVHERIHKGDKKHICSVCGKGFLEKSYMLKHLRGVHSK